MIVGLTGGSGDFSFEPPVYSCTVVFELSVCDTLSNHACCHSF
jgi:hypothetical protein